MRDDDYEEELTYEEMKQMVNDDWDLLTDDQQYYKYQTNDITFEEWVFSMMKPTQKVIINFDKYEHKFIDNA